LGTLLFSIYVSPVGRLIRHFNVDFHQYADDITLYTAITFDSQASNQQSRCTAAIQLWFRSNGLLSNPDKSVAAIFGTNQRLSRPGWPSHVNIARADIFLYNKLKLLGVTLDLSMKLDLQVAATVRSCNYHLQALRSLRNSLPRDIAVNIACSIIGSRLD